MERTNERTANDREEPALGFLCAPLRAEEALRRQRERVEGLESRCGRLTAAYGPTGRGSGEGPERLWARLADERAEAARLERLAKRLRRGVERALREVADPAAREALRLRYLEGLTWPAAGERLGCSLRTVYRLHRRGTAEVDQLLCRRKSRCA